VKVAHDAGIVGEDDHRWAANSSYHGTSIQIGWLPQQLLATAFHTLNVLSGNVT
jgi:hypothetical protein